MGLRLDPNCAEMNFRNEKDAHYPFIHQNPSFDLKNAFLMKILFINQRYGTWLQSKQSDVHGGQHLRWDFSYLEFIRKAVEYETDEEVKLEYLHALRNHEAIHYLHTESIKEIKPLIQFCPGSNLELKEAKVELYKISVSFSTGGKIGKFSLITIVFLKGLKHK